MLKYQEDLPKATFGVGYLDTPLFLSMHKKLPSHWQSWLNPLYLLHSIQEIQAAPLCAKDSNGYFVPVVVFTRSSVYSGIITVIYPSLESAVSWRHSTKTC